MLFYQMCIRDRFITVTLIYQLVGFVRHYSQNFRQYAWKDANRARQLLNQGMEMVNNNPMVETLHPLVCAVIDVIAVSYTHLDVYKRQN